MSEIHADDAASQALNDVPELDESDFEEIDDALDSGDDLPSDPDPDADDPAPSNTSDPDGDPEPNEPDAPDEETPDDDPDLDAEEELDDEELPDSPDDVMSPEEAEAAFRQQYEETRTQALAELQEIYALDEETIAEFETNPGQVLSNLAARIALDVTQTALSTMQARLPVLMQQQTDYDQRAAAFTEVFFEEWPDLKGEDALPTVRRLGEMYRQQNPSASPDEYIRDVGAMSMVALKKDPTRRAPTDPGSEVPAARRARRERPAPQPQRRQPPTTIEEQFQSVDEELFDDGDF